MQMVDYAVNMVLTENCCNICGESQKAKKIDASINKG